MPKLRFATAKEVFEAVPALADDMRSGPSGEKPVGYIHRLAAGETPEDALTFAAYALGRREAVWWACQAVRGLGAAEPTDEGLTLAESWVREPGEEQRRAALAHGTAADKAVPSAWLALAAAWSGGSIVAGPTPVQTSAHLTPKAARSAVLIALAHVPAARRADRLKMCIDVALGLMQEEAGSPR